jgi:hypothetical protein
MQFVGDPWQVSDLRRAPIVVNFGRDGAAITVKIAERILAEDES